MDKNSDYVRDNYAFPLHFSGCCGIKIFTSFGYSKDSVGSPDTNEIKKLVVEYMKDFKHRVGLCLIALTDGQRKIYHEILLDIGFVVLTNNFYHPVTGNYLTLYGYTTHSDEEAEECKKKRSEVPTEGLLFSSMPRQMDSSTPQPPATSYAPDYTPSRTSHRRASPTQHRENIVQSDISNQYLRMSEMALINTPVSTMPLHHPNLERYYRNGPNRTR